MDEDDAEYSTLIQEEGSFTVKTSEANSNIGENGSGTNQSVAMCGRVKESWVEKLGLQLPLDPDFHCIAWGFAIGVSVDIM